MKKILAAIASLFVIASISYAITVNPASNVTADSANTATTIVLRDANGSFAAGQFIPLSQTATQISTLVPLATGAVVFNSTHPSLCVSTGTTAGAWVFQSTSTALGNVCN